MDHDRTLEGILASKVIVVLRGIPKERIRGVALALYAGGIRAVECALPHGRETDPSSVLQSIETLRELGRELDLQDLLVGCGTVLTPEEARQAASAGALFAISPVLDEEVIRSSKALGLVSIPGAYTPTEIAAASRWGADIVKVFPAGQLGPGYFKALQGPLGHIPLAAVAGITPDNARSFLDAGACCLGVSSYLASPSLREEQMEERARIFLGAVRKGEGSE